MNINQAFGLKQRSTVSISSNYLRIKFHDGSGTTAAWTKQVAGTTSTGTYTINGTTGSIWANGGYITPAGDNYLLVSDGSLDDIVNPSASGGILILARFLYTTHIGLSSTYNHLLCVGSDGNAGGYVLRVNVEANTNLALSAGASDGTQVQVQKSLTAKTNTVLPICAYLDMPTRTVSLSDDGNWAGAVSNTFNGTTVPKIPTGYGVTVLSKHNGTLTPSGYLNVATGNIGGRLSDLLIINDSSRGLYSSLGTIATEHKNYPVESLWSLDGK